MTSQPTEPNHIQQTLSLGAFPVSQSPKQGTEKASRRLQGLVSGFNSSEPYAWYDQNTSSWKTYQRSLLTEWTSFSETFTRQGTMQNGVVYQAALLELATKGIAGGCLDFLPTPTVCNDSMYYDKSPNKDKRHSKGLATEIIDREMLPTPRASEPGRTNLGYGDNLKEGICKQIGIPTKKYPMLPTPRASDVEGGVVKDVQYKNETFYRENKEGVRWGVKLRDAVSILPTPTATDYKGRSGQGFIDRHGKRRISDVLTQTGDNTYLNPRFVEEMMGYPLNWTQVKESKD